MELLDLKEGAKELRVSVHTLRAWGHQRRFPFIRLGRRILLRREDIDAFINKSVIGAKDD